MKSNFSLRATVFFIYLQLMIQLKLKYPYRAFWYKYDTKKSTFTVRKKATFFY